MATAASVHPSDIPDSTLERMSAVEKKYDEERYRRYRSEGAAQYVVMDRVDKLKHYAADPWYDPKQPPRGRQDLPEDFHSKFLVLGSGFAALLYAVRLIESGVSAKDITMIDSSGGFGGTWYWNRCPGLMCDIESTVYIPLLEETGYIPKHRYEHGTDLREYAEEIARRWKLDDSVIFRSTLHQVTWDEEAALWKVDIAHKLHDETEIKATLRCDFFVQATGFFVQPKIPIIPGFETFTGHIFHTSRWDYRYTGGSQVSPEMRNLQDKKVAIIGTGATAVQAVPELAKWAKKLYVFQRTPASVDIRDQRAINPMDFDKIRTKKGWQRERQENFVAFTLNVPNKPAVDMVDDSATKFPSVAGVGGSPAVKSLPLEKTMEYISMLSVLDFSRAERIRARVDEIVKDPDTAESLKPWYAGWCKRPCFHDEYLQSFNLPNVQLVDTKGKGPEKITEDGLIYHGQQYDVDLIIFSTGYEAFGQGGPAHRAGLKVIGRNGMSLEDKWTNNISTFQGLFTRNFPNLILPPGSQGTLSINHTHVMEIYSSHVSKVISEAKKRAGSGERVIIEPSQESEQEWTRKIMSFSHALASMMSCTPSWFTNEADMTKQPTPEQQVDMAKRAVWMPGLLDYCEEINSWLRKGDLEGLEISVVPDVN